MCFEQLHAIVNSAISQMAAPVEILFDMPVGVERSR